MSWYACKGGGWEGRGLGQAGFEKGWVWEGQGWEGRFLRGLRGASQFFFLASHVPLAPLHSPPEQNTCHTG